MEDVNLLRVIHGAFMLEARGGLPLSGLVFSRLPFTGLPFTGLPFTGLRTAS